jgi:predicted ATPase/class 3 adenylate cyclase
MDRRQALASGSSLPAHTLGAALFADISGFTPLTEALARELGPSLGAEELTRHLNRVYEALISELHRLGGSVIGFSGDAITCWLDGDDGTRATACALAMQAAMGRFSLVKTPAGTSISLGIKAAVATGPVHRFLVGDPAHCLLDAMAGATLDRLAAAEHLAERGEVVVDTAAAVCLGEWLAIREWREDAETGSRVGVVAGLVRPVADAPWSPLAADALEVEQTRGWVLPPVSQRLESGRGEFLAELRPAVALFLLFGGIDYDSDPAASAKLDRFARQVEGVLSRYDGSLLNLTIGDKGSYLYACFGAPVAHEDDAARAASAALELQGLGAGLDYLDPLQIGIAGGRMRTGAYGSRSRRTYSALGDAVNLSARLMTAADPGQILVTEGVCAAAGDTFAWEALPPITVKGKRAPVAVARLVGRRELPTTRILEPQYALPMIGRQAELAHVEKKVEQVLGGKGQIVGITAEAGMGKSRLAAEVIHLALEAGLATYGGECQSYGTTTSYLVWRSVWRGLFGLEPVDSLDAQREKLGERLQQIDPGLLPRLPLLGAVLNLPIADTELTRSLEAKQRKSSLEALIVDCLRARAADGPLLVVLEDCHWLDPLSRDLTEEVGRAIADRPVLLLLVYRPPDVEGVRLPRVGQLAHFTEITLAEFSRQEAERLIQLKLERLLGHGAQPDAAFVSQITARASGNPFYIEELVNYLRDRDIDPGDRGALAQVELPSSLHSLILSRVDQLAEHQQTTLKVASVIGRLFRAAMVWGVCPQLGSYGQVKASLRRLSNLDIAPLDTPEPELTYLFKHIITQEVAYESLLHSTRAKLHEQIGLYVERMYPDSLNQYVSLLAFHFERSEDEDKKREYLTRAGEAAQADYANDAAIEYFEKLLPLIGAVDKGRVLLNLGKIYELIGQFDAADERYHRALDLGATNGDCSVRAWSEAALGQLHRKQGQYDAATEWLETARLRFEELGDESGVGQVLHYAGMVADQQGHFEAARSLWQESLAIRRRLDDQVSIGGLLSNLGIVAGRQGDMPAAQALLEESLAVRRQINDRWAIAVTLSNLGFLALLAGQADEARPLLEEAVTLQREVGDRWMLGNALNNLANVARDQGDAAEAGALYGESLGIYRLLGDSCALAYLLEDVGRLAAAEGATDLSLCLAGAAAALRQEIGAPLTASESEQLEAALAPSRKALAAKAQHAWDKGSSLSLDQAIDLALRHVRAERTPSTGSGSA